MILIQEEGKISGFMLATVLSNSGEQSKGKLKLRLLCEGRTKNIIEDVKVVTPFGGADKKAIEEAVALSVGAVKTWLEEGVGPAMNRYNTKTH